MREANQDFSQVIAAAERGETIVVTKNGRPVARIIPGTHDREGDPEWRAGFASLEKSLRSKRGSGRRVGAITEGDKYGDEERVALDSHILICAEIEPDSAKGMRSADLILGTCAGRRHTRASPRRISPLRPAPLPRLVRGCAPAGATLSVRIRHAAAD